ncbi:MAG: hypothetical protein AAB092_09625, partial [Chloroflexota bacterium]
MNERERADALARAIDELIRGAQTPEPRFDDEELRSLLRVAGARRQAAIETGRRSADHESAVWERLVARLENHDGPEGDEPKDPNPDDDLRDVVAARRRVSEDVLQLAEQHRDDVWRRVQERISNQRPKRRGIFSFLQARTTGDMPVRRPGWGHTGLMLTGDPDVDSLLRISLANPALPEASKRRMSEPQSQLRARLRLDPAHQRQPTAEASPARPSFLLRASVVIAIALAALVLGPIPVTGLSGSPAVEAAQYLGEHLGVTETDQSPPTPGEAESVTGRDTTVADASYILGLPLLAPGDFIGLPLSSQRIFPEGPFIATYASADGAASASIHEEAAGGDDLAVPEGSAVDTLVNGSAATYYEGGWS